MGPKDFVALCGSPDASFSAIVSASLTVFGLLQRELATEFEVSESTVSRWAKGEVSPHPKFQALVRTSLKKRAERMVRKLAVGPTVTGGQPVLISAEE